MRAQVSPPAEAASIAAERQRIDRERAQGNAAFNAQEQACQTAFAVTACLHDVGMRRIALLSDLKRQEIRLNDAERAQRGAEQGQRTQDKATQRVRDSADVPVGPDTSFQEKQKAQRDKQEAHRKTETANQGGVAAFQPALRSAPDTAVQEQNRLAFARKQEEAIQRRLERDKRMVRKLPSERTALPTP